MATPVLEFTQGEGFKEIDSPVEWKDDWDEERWWKEIGYQGGISFLGDFGEEGSGLRILPVQSQRHPYLALVEYRSQGEGETIFVRNSADLMALKVRLAPVIMADAPYLLRELQSLAGKAFRAWHGHPAHRPCDECDPDGVAEEREEAERLAKLDLAQKARAYRP